MIRFVSLLVFLLPSCMGFPRIICKKQTALEVVSEAYSHKKQVDGGYTINSEWVNVKDLYSHKISALVKKLDKTQKNVWKNPPSSGLFTIDSYHLFLRSPEDKAGTPIEVEGGGFSRKIVINDQVYRQYQSDPGDVPKEYHLRSLKFTLIKWRDRWVIDEIECILNVGEFKVRKEDRDHSFTLSELLENANKYWRAKY